MQSFTVTKGATSVILPVSIYDSSSTTGAKLAGLAFNTASLTAYYNRMGASGAATAITLATATKGTWATGGFVAIDGTNMPGDYELHVPDAAFATGVNEVSIQLKGAANMVPVNLTVHLRALDLQITPVAANVTTWNGTSVATPDTAGYPKVTVKSGTGTGEVSLTSGIASVNATQVNSSATAAANLAAAARGIVLGTVDTAGFAATNTEFETNITEATASHYNGKLVIFYTGALAGQQTLVSAYSLATGRGHFTVVAMTEAPANGDLFVLV